MSKFFAFVLFAFVAVTSIGCAGSEGGSGPVVSYGQNGQMSITTERFVTAMDGRQYKLSQLEPQGGQLPINGVQCASFKKKRSFGDKLGSFALNTGGAALGGFGGAHAGRAISSGPIGTSVGAVTGGAAGAGLASGLAGDGNGIIWVPLSELGQATASAN